MFISFSINIDKVSGMKWILKICVSFAVKYIRIYHECERRIEKFIPRITLWHHKACQVMRNGDHNGQIFVSFPHTNSVFFFLLTPVLFIYLFILK